MSLNKDDKKCVFVIVEGESDTMLFKPLLGDSVILLESYDGKNGISEIIFDEIIRNNNRCIGIRDRDYETIEYPHIFFCDFSCVEMMMISIDDCLIKFCSNYFPYRNNYIELRKSSLKQLFYLSSVRRFSEEHSLQIKTEGLNIRTVYNINYDKMNENIKNNKKKCGGIGLLSQKALENGLRCAFSIESFRKTDLYKKLLQYQKEYKLQILR